MKAAPVGVKSRFLVQALPMISTKDFAYPCGLHDPLRRIEGLCRALSDLWRHGDRSLLRAFTQFRLSNRGLLPGRESEDAERWITLIAYCGGDKLDAKKNRIGKCLTYPLVFGREKTCSICGKLICCTCGFCIKDCQGSTERMREQAKNKERIQPPPSDYDETQDPGYWESLIQEYEKY